MTSAAEQNKNRPILITGSGGFIGRNLTARLKAMGYTNLLRFDLDTPKDALAEYVDKASFVFHLAGVNRPKNPEEFYSGNASLTQQLIHLLEQKATKTPILLSSTAQAGNETDYAKSKEQAEQAVFSYSQSHQAPVYVYRLPGVFGKWSRPSYNSVVATFCYNIARDLEISVRDEDFELPLCYIDDVVDHFIHNLEHPHAESATPEYLSISPVYTVKLGELASLIQSFKQGRTTLSVPSLDRPFEQKLYATYLSYLPEDQFSYPLTMHQDQRGSFTEFLRTPDRGQVSVNVAKPGIVKGNHWHDTKNEKFLVVSGTAIIRFRRVGETQVYEYTVSGNELEVLDIPTGYTHNIENIGTEDLVTLMWASEPFDPNKSDTHFEEV